MSKKQNHEPKTANTPPWVERKNESMPLGRSPYLLGGDGPKTAGNINQYRQLGYGSLSLMQTVERTAEMVRALEQYKGTEIWDRLETLGKSSNLRVRRDDGMSAIHAAASLLALEEKETGKIPEDKLFGEIERILNSNQGSFKYATQEGRDRGFRVQQAAYDYYGSRGGRW